MTKKAKLRETIAHFYQYAYEGNDEYKYYGKEWERLTKKRDKDEN